MSNYEQTVKDLRKFAGHFKAIVNLSDKLEGISSLEQAENEAKMRHQKALAEVEGVERQVKDKHAEMDRVQNQMTEVRAQATDIVEKAKGRAGEIIVAAQKRSDESDAKNKFENQAHEVDMDLKRAAKNNLEIEVRAKEAKLDNIKSQLDAIKIKIANLVGA